MMKTHVIKILVLVTVVSVGARKLFDSSEELNRDFDWINTGVCQTDECKIIGRELLQGMNKSVDPCDDFYEYMCGNWIKKHRVPPFAPWWNRVFIFQDTIYRRIKNLLEIPPKSSEILPVRQIKKWFHSCMDTDKLDKRGLGPIESILVQTGGWPMILDAEEWDVEEQSWQGIEDHYFHVTGSHVFYKISASTYEDNATELSIGPFPLQDKLQYEFRNHSGNISVVYKAIIKGVAQIFIKQNKANIPNKKLNEDIENLIEFERKLYMLSQIEKSGAMSIQTIDEFIDYYENQLAPYNQSEKFDFLHLIQQTFDMINFHVNRSEKLYVELKPYWVNLTRLLNLTPTRTIVNYIHWNVISRMLPYTTEDIRDMLFALGENELDLKARPPRWWECVKEMKMTTAMSYVFVQKYFPNETEQSARKMIKNIRKEIEHQITTSRWIDANAKKLAIEKLNSMEVFVAFPEWYKNKTRVVNAYKGLVIGTEYLDNILSYQKYSVKRQLKLVHGLTSTYEKADEDTININAMYSYGSNSIRLPAADFQAPLFTQHLPLAINYGMTGAIIGHEIGHGFDNDGFKYAADGHEADVSKYVRETYYKRAECFVHQYNKYNGVTEPDILLNTRIYPTGGRLTQGENLADSTGLHAVYEAYRKEMKITRGDLKLPGFEDFTDDQLFFMAFGALWCEVKTRKFAELSKTLDSHSSGRLRCIGSVSNINDFAKAFNCPPASPMNPVNKCDIWDAPEPYETADNKKKFVVD